jgi:hypothetical protein
MSRPIITRQRAAWLTCALCALLTHGQAARAGVVNPNISVIGQPELRLTNDPADANRDRLLMDPGEVELVFDDYLNPFTRGNVTLSIADGDVELEEGYFALVRGLPGTLNLKGGKWRLDFGKLNARHPHIVPFAGRFRVLSTYLPGDESFNETGLELSSRLPAPGELSLVASVDWLQGDTFRREREDSGGANDPLGAGGDGDRGGEARPAVLGRLSGFALVGDRSGLEIGLSATSGINNVAAAARTTVCGADLRAKLWHSERSYLVLQAEALRLDRQDAGWDPVAAAFTRDSVEPWGWYVFGDYNFDQRWNLGASWERYRQDNPDQAWEHAVGVFAGCALMEETTVFRLGWEHFQAGRGGDGPTPDAVDTFSLRMIFAMGPHKAHQF